MGAMESYWERMIRIRESLGMTKDELAQAAGVTSSYIYRIEKGAVDTPSYKTVLALSKALRITVDELMGESPVPENLWGVNELYRTIQEAAPDLAPADRIAWLRLINEASAEQRVLIRQLFSQLQISKKGSSGRVHETPAEYKPGPGDGDEKAER